MTPELAAGLRALAASLPPATPVPVPAEVLLELLSGDGLGTLVPPTAELAPADLTVADLAARFGKRPSTVRTWVERGEFPGAYRLHGREWRVPAAALIAFEATARTGRSPAPRAKGKAVNLAAWRSAS